jgi:hypothetical protein
MSVEESEEELPAGIASVSISGEETDIKTEENIPDKKSLDQA